MNAKATKPAAKTEVKIAALDPQSAPQGSSAGSFDAALNPPDTSEAPADVPAVSIGGIDGAEPTYGTQTSDELQALPLLRPTFRVKRVHPDAQIPQYATAGAACFDLHVIDGGHIAPGGARTFHTGLAVEIPEGFAMKIYSRSGQGRDNGIRLANGTGIIDSDYRGALVITLHNDSRNGVFEVKPGMRIAQALLAPAEQWQIEEVSELSATARGIGGHGSTGA